MKKIFYIFLLVFMLTSASYSYNGGVQDRLFANEEFLAMENKSFLIFYQQEYDKVKAYVEGMATCAAKYKYYVPGGVGLDSDDCYDLITKLSPPSSVAKKAEYVDFMSAAGDLRYFSAPDTRDRHDYSGVLIADRYCDNDFAGSRAMRYGDMKYIINDLPTLTHPIFVFDAIKNFEGTDQVRLKTGELSVAGDGKNWNCSNYTSRAATSKSVRYQTINTESRMFVTDVDCSQEGYIVCVQDQ
ncbi:MAG: hypothetical protein GY793_05135 [Proteobacteria bacterium]|nr:hypothetical protein [Pseudomonadota bacterium]